jgi:hypothetical protein
MEKSPTPYISNKAMALAAIAALISLGSLILSFLPREDPPHAEIASASPSPSLTTSPTPKPTRESKPEPTQKSRPSPTPNLEQEVRRLEEQLGQIKQELEPKSQRPRPAPTPDYPYRHTPSLVSPSDGAVFAHYPRKLTLRWRPTAASEADGYKVTVECGDPFRPVWWKCHDIETPWNYCTIDFDGAQPGRWRVTPTFADGRSGIPTEWRTFRFTQ